MRGPGGRAPAGRATLSREQIELLLRARGLRTDRPPALVHTVATQFRHVLGPLVLSLWESDGVDLGPAFRAQLASQRARERWCRAVLERLRERVEGVTVLKGLSIADRYPAGWVRPFGDLDLCVERPRALLDAWRLLVADGYEVKSMAVRRRGGRTQWAVTLQDGAPRRFDELPRCVELGTSPLFGSLVGLPPREITATDGDVPVLRDILAILEEGFQRPYSTRDLLDVIVCCHVLPAGARENLEPLVARHGLLPEYYRLARLLDDWRPFGVDVRAPGPLPVAAARVRRWTVPPGSGALRPATLHRWVQRRALPVANRPAPPGTVAPAGRGATVVDRAARRVPARPRARQWRDGLLFLGVPVDPQPLPPARWGLSPPDAPRVAETPSGRFLLTTQAAVYEHEVAAAARHEPAGADRERD